MKQLNSSSMPLNGRILIEASAGTGKTYTISSLYLRLLLGREPSMPRPLLNSEILVLTFTIAATDELRTRIRKRVTLARDMFNGREQEQSDDFIAELITTSTDLSTERRLLTVALQTMDEAAIFTIHGFCARVLGEQSFDAGMLFDQNLDGDRDQLLQIAAQDCFRREILSLPPGPQLRALQIFKSPDHIADMVKKFLFRHNLSYLPGEDENSDIMTLVELNEHIKQRWLEDDVTKTLQHADLKANVLTAKRLNDTDPNFVEHYCRSELFDPDFWSPWTSEGISKATKKGAELPEHAVFAQIDKLLQLSQGFETNLYHRVTRFIKAHLSTAKQDHGQLTVDDLLLEVHRAVKNGTLADLLRSKWPAAMIDEFQDTDDLQYEIFSTIYPAQHTNAGTLLFIGDPKQAIYNFRGADVFTYINARQTTDAGYSLATNWRSTPAMVEAVNHLFQQPDSFGDDEQIRFEPVEAAPPNQKLSLTIEGVSPPPMSLFFDDAKTAGENRDNLMNHAAEETARLLNLAREGKALIDGVPISPGQIAFLVRSRTDAAAARQALTNRGIRSVYVTLESVFLTDTADDLKRILHAVLEPTDEVAIKSALGTKLMQGTAQEVMALSEDWNLLHAVMEEFQQYHQLWASSAVAPMLEALISRRQLAEKWLHHPDGDRQLTNLRHLTELLQTRSMTAPGMRRLLKWYERERVGADTVAAEERQLRLESDSNLVQIVTMHASKGLEYDIVMIPSAGFDPITDKFPLFHQQDEDGEFNIVIDFAAEQASKESRKLEDLAEITRLLYVAITRAKYRCYLGFSANKVAKDKPFARLLRLTDKNPDAIRADLTGLPQTLFALAELHTSQTQFQAQQNSVKLQPALALPDVTNDWRMHSYTGLTRLLTSGGDSDVEANAETPTRPGFGDDDQHPREGAATTSASRFNFPRGARVGIVLHSFMEHLDFAASEAEVREQARLSLAKMAIKDEDGVWQEVLLNWFRDIVSTPIAGSLSLKDVSRSNRLDEMEFHFPIAANRDLLSELKQAQILPQHMNLKVATLTGMMTGYIDLIIAMENRFYLIDYKSNDLGPDQASYDDEHLHTAVKHHHYDLQYLIYCVALHRYLKQRVPGYQFKQHFGGVRYLFLRGMSGANGGGVYAAEPEQALIEKLDQLLAGRNHG